MGRIFARTLQLPGLPSDPLARSLPDSTLLRVAEETRGRGRVHADASTESGAGNHASAASDGEGHVYARQAGQPLRVSHKRLDVPQEIDGAARLHSTHFALAIPVAKRVEARGGVRMDFVNHNDRGPEKLDWAPTGGLAFLF